MGGYVYHVLNRAVGRATLFYQEGDYAAFENTLRAAKEWQPIRLLAYALLPTLKYPGTASLEIRQA